MSNSQPLSDITRLRASPVFTHNFTPKERHSALSRGGAKRVNITFLDNCLSPSGLEAPGGKEACLVHL